MAPGASGREFPRAVFGENLTTEGLVEDVRIGDRFRIGTAEFIVTQPRLPCYKLGIRFSRMDMLKRMLRNGRTGFYFAVTQEGEVGAGDVIEPIERVDEGLTVADVVRLYTVDAKNRNYSDARRSHRGFPRAGRIIPQEAMGPRRIKPAGRRSAGPGRRRGFQHGLPDRSWRDDRVGPFPDATSRRCREAGARDDRGRRWRGRSERVRAFSADRSLAGAPCFPHRRTMGHFLGEAWSLRESQKPCRGRPAVGLVAARVLISPRCCAGTRKWSTR